MSSSSSLEWIFLPIAATAAAAVIGLASLQSDPASRQLLSPSRLDAKRQQQYAYEWKTKTIAKLHYLLDRWLVGDEQSSNPEELAKQFEFRSSKDDMNELIQRLLKGKNNTSATVWKIDRDIQDPTGEFYVYLLVESQANQSEIQTFYQMPLVPFCQQLRDAFQQQITTTTLCFVADASSGEALELIPSLLRSTSTTIAIVSQPLWMLQLARIVQAQVLPKDAVDAILFALCRLESSSHTTATNIKTVLFTLPGQATTSTLLPLVHRVFPEDRHVFCYQGCVASVSRGLELEKGASKTKQVPPGTLTDVKTHLYGLHDNPILHTTPLATNTPLTKSLLPLADSLSQLPLALAKLTEVWMTSVDAFLRCKEENHLAYLPYVCQLELLKKQTQFDEGTDGYWSLMSLLQFILGARSRALPEGVFEAARETLVEYNDNQGATTTSDVPISAGHKSAIENAVFQHKGILIGNKTLIDTVMPRQHWTLKQAAKNGGCACCGPDPFEDEDDEEKEDELSIGRNKKANDIMSSFLPPTRDGGSEGLRQRNTPSATSSAISSSAKKKQQPGYVDGTQGFAFDPSRFG